jgi:hypothetical protein
VWGKFPQHTSSENTFQENLVLLDNLCCTICEPVVLYGHKCIGRDVPVHCARLLGDIANITPSFSSACLLHILFRLKKKMLLKTFSCIVFINCFPVWYRHISEL